MRAHTGRQHMRDFLSSFVLFCLVLLLPGCFAANPIQLYQIDSGRTINMAPGSVLEIVLDSNPTTGYQWKALPWHTAVIEQVGKPAYKPRSEAIGSGGELTFHFKALSKGQTQLEFIYHRSFEKGVPPIKSFKVTLVVS